MERPIFYGSDSDFLIGSGRCLIVGTYFKDKKIDMVRVCEKRFIESTKKIYDFIHSLKNEMRMFYFILRSRFYRCLQDSRYYIWKVGRLYNS